MTMEGGRSLVTASLSRWAGFLLCLWGHLNELDTEAYQFLVSTLSERSPLPPGGWLVR
jgi:hypothetical protein